MAWNLLKDYLEYQGNQEIRGSRDAIREAFKVNLVSDGKVWMETIKAKNITSHTYNEELVQSAFYAIVNEYAYLFDELLKTFEKIEEKEQEL